MHYFGVSAVIKGDLQLHSYPTPYPCWARPFISPHLTLELFALYDFLSHGTSTITSSGVENGDSRPLGRI